MKKLLCMLLLLGALSVSAKSSKPAYLNPKLTVEERVEDLIKRMTIEEKVGQMNQFCGVYHVENRDKKLQAENPDAQGFYKGINGDTIRKWTRQGLIGSFLHVLTVEEANELQRLAMESRLGIPIIFGIDAIHGNCLAPNNTSYPTSLTLACSFDTDMAYKIARQTALEMRAMNMHWTFNPNVDVARDARWGRCGETFGEDPYLVGQMGLALVNGYQGDMTGSDDVLACIKHCIADSQPINGGNHTPTDVSERTLKEVFLPPYELAIREGAVGSLMTAHNEVNGVPCHKNKWLMEDIMRKEYGFTGFIVSDWMDIERLHTLHRTAPTRKEAYYQAIMAGMDMHMHGIHWNEEVVELVREGRIPESRIDVSVRRILTAKFRLGLFEHPYADEKRIDKVRMCAEHRQTALEAARKSIVLLKNDGILPLDINKYKRVLVTGINADDENIMGDWSAPQKPENVTTILEGLRAMAPNTEFLFVDQGLSPLKMKQECVDRAAEVALTADLNIVVAGETSLRARASAKTCGENQDRATICLFGLQQELVKRVAASGKPTILIVVAGRPQSLVWEDANLPAIICAWEPGMLGGQAVAEIVYGKVNPSGKLAMTMPRHEGQIQMYYNHKPSIARYKLRDMSTKPLYPFGHGLSYTTYEYSDLKLSTREIAKDGTVDVSVTVKNTGARDGEEIVQLYIHDCYSDVTRPVKELKGFARVPLKSGESREVRFRLTPEHLRYYDIDMNRIVEAGEYEVLVGPSSRTKELLKASFVVK